MKKKPLKRKSSYGSAPVVHRAEGNLFFDFAGALRLREALNAAIDDLRSLDLRDAESQRVLVRLVLDQGGRVGLYRTRRTRTRRTRTQRAATDAFDAIPEPERRST
jgi:hypothetical protein